MKIRSVRFNNKRKGFEASVSRKTYVFTYVKARPSPTSDDPVTRVYVDKELCGEGFTYELQSGKTGTVHVEQVLEYNRDPNYLERSDALQIDEWRLRGVSLIARFPSAKSFGG